MATIVPNTSSSQALITPGWPLVSVEKSNPVADKEAAAGSSGIPASAARQSAIHQSGHDSDRA